MTYLSLFLIFGFYVMSIAYSHIAESLIDDEDCVESFFKKYYPSLCFFANRFVTDKEAAEDIVGEALLKVWEKRDRLDNPVGLKNYCYTVVRHGCLHWLKSRQRGADIQSEEAHYSEETVLHNIIRTEVLEELHTAISRLPPKSCQVFSKLYIEGKSVAETARELRLTVSTIKSHKRTGLALLRSMITRVLLFITAALLGS